MISGDFLHEHISISDRISVLSKARDIIATKGWIQGSLAKDNEGRNVSPLCKDAVGYCAMGAIEKASYDFGKYFGDGELMTCVVSEQFFDSLDEDGSISSWNDKKGRKKEDVIRIFRYAISKLEKDRGTQI